MNGYHRLVEQVKDYIVISNKNSPPTLVLISSIMSLISSHINHTCCEFFKTDIRKLGMCLKYVV